MKKKLEKGERLKHWENSWIKYLKKNVWKKRIYQEQACPHGAWKCGNLSYLRLIIRETILHRNGLVMTSIITQRLYVLAEDYLHHWRVLESGCWGRDGFISIEIDGCVVFTSHEMSKSDFFWRKNVNCFISLTEETNWGNFIQKCCSSNNHSIKKGLFLISNEKWTLLIGPRGYHLEVTSRVIINLDLTLAPELSLVTIPVTTAQ